MEAGEARTQPNVEKGQGTENLEEPTEIAAIAAPQNPETPAQTRKRRSEQALSAPIADEPLTVRKTLPISATNAMAITALQELRDAAKRKTTEAQIIHEALTMYFREHPDGISAMKLAKLKMEFLS